MANRILEDGICSPSLEVSESSSLCGCCLNFSVVKIDDFKKLNRLFLSCTQFIIFHFIFSF